MALATCPGCSRVLDIPGKPQSYRQPDGRCARCNEIAPVKLPDEVVKAFKPEAHVPPPPERGKYLPANAVETSVPLPGKKPRKPEYHSVYPLDKLKAPKGDEAYSFLVPCPDNQRAVVQRQVTSAVGYFRKKTKSKAKFTVRQVEGGVRVWRIA